jgi:hypothetical protein
VSIGIVVAVGTLMHEGANLKVVLGRLPVSNCLNGIP